METGRWGGACSRRERVVVGAAPVLLSGDQAPTRRVLTWIWMPTTLPRDPGPRPRCVWSPLDAAPGTRDEGSLWARSICPGELYTHYATDSDRYSSIGFWRVTLVNGVPACCEDYYCCVEVCKIENLHGKIVLLHLRGLNELSSLYFSCFFSDLGNCRKVDLKVRKSAAL